MRHNKNKRPKLLKFGVFAVVAVLFLNLLLWHFPVVTYAATASVPATTTDKDTLQDRYDKEYEKVKNQDVCDYLKLNNKLYSNPFEAILCRMIKFYEEKIFNPFMQLMCEIGATGYRSNYSLGLVGKVKYINGRCVTTD